MHKACIGVDIGCDCSCHISIKTMRRDAKQKKSAERVAVAQT